ncbi:hypothetical protein D3C81_1399510 [compost metagenome]
MLCLPSTFTAYSSPMDDGSSREPCLRAIDITTRSLLAHQKSSTTESAAPETFAVNALSERRRISSAVRSSSGAVTA